MCSAQCRNLKQRFNVLKKLLLSFGLLPYKRGKHVHQSGFSGNSSQLHQKKPQDRRRRRKKRMKKRKGGGGGREEKGGGKREDVIIFSKKEKKEEEEKRRRRRGNRRSKGKKRRNFVKACNSEHFSHNYRSALASILTSPSFLPSVPTLVTALTLSAAHIHIQM